MSCSVLLFGFVIITDFLPPNPHNCPNSNCKQLQAARDCANKILQEEEIFLDQFYLCPNAFCLGHFISPVFIISESNIMSYNAYKSNLFSWISIPCEEICCPQPVFSLQLLLKCEQLFLLHWISLIKPKQLVVFFWGFFTFSKYKVSQFSAKDLLLFSHP